MVKSGELDIYMAVTNYRVPAGQEVKMVEMFSCIGCQRVVVVGKESLTRWIRESRHLTKVVFSLYGIGGTPLRNLALYSAKGVKKLKKNVQVMYLGIVEQLFNTGKGGVIETGEGD